MTMMMTPQWTVFQQHCYDGGVHEPRAKATTTIPVQQKPQSLLRRCQSLPAEFASTATKNKSAMVSSSFKRKLGERSAMVSTKMKNDSDGFFAPFPPTPTNSPTNSPPSSPRSATRSASANMKNLLPHQPLRNKKITVKERQTQQRVTILDKETRRQLLSLEARYHHQSMIMQQQKKTKQHLHQRQKCYAYHDDDEERELPVELRTHALNRYRLPRQNSMIMTNNSRSRSSRKYAVGEVAFSSPDRYFEEEDGEVDSFRSSEDLLGLSFIE